LRASSRDDPAVALCARPPGAARSFEPEIAARGPTRRRHSPPDSNPSQLGIEPVSVHDANSRWETVWRGQRPAPHSWRPLHILRVRDQPLSRLRRQSPGKLKTFPPAPGNRLYAGLRGGAGRTQTGNQPIMGPNLIINGRRRAFAARLGRGDCGPIERGPPAQAPSR
jgi:hypothetical protein